MTGTAGGKAGRSHGRVKNALRGVSIRKQFLTTLAIVVLIAIAATWGGLIAQAKANAAAEFAHDHALVPANALATLRSSVNRWRK